MLIDILIRYYSFYWEKYLHRKGCRAYQNFKVRGRFISKYVLEMVDENNFFLLREIYQYLNRVFLDGCSRIFPSNGSQEMKRAVAIVHIEYLLMNDEVFIISSPEPWVKGI